MRDAQSAWEQHAVSSILEYGKGGKVVKDLRDKACKTGCKAEGGACGAGGDRWVAWISVD